MLANFSLEQVQSGMFSLLEHPINVKMKQIGVLAHRRKQSLASCEMKFEILGLIVSTNFHDLDFCGANFGHNSQFVASLNVPLDARQTYHTV